MKVISAIRKVARAPKVLSNKIHESLESFTEMAPYIIGNMSSSMSGSTIVGVGSMHADPTKVNPKRSPFSDYRRREMLAWHFLAMDRTLFGRFSSSAGLKWIRLGEFYMENGDPARALTYGPKGLAIVEGDREPDPADKIMFMARRKVADFYLKMYRDEEACDLLRKILDDLMQLEDSEEELVIAMKQYYECLMRLEKHGEAIEVLLKLVKRLESSGVPADEYVLVAYKALADSYGAIGEADKAEHYGSLAEHFDWLWMMEKPGDKESRILLKELSAIEAAYTGLGKLELAREIRNRINIIHIASKVNGPDYPGIEADLDKLAKYYEVRGEGGDGTVAFHIRKRIKRIKDAKLGRK